MHNIVVDVIVGGIGKIKSVNTVRQGIIVDFIKVRISIK